MTEEKSMVDALIQNPFGEDVVKNTTLQDVASDFPQEQVDAKRALVDTLPEKQQEQGEPPHRIRSRYHQLSAQPEVEIIRSPGPP